MSDFNNDYYLTCDVCRNLHLKSKMLRHTENAVGAHLHDSRSGYYFLCRYCIGDKTVISEDKEKEKNDTKNMPVVEYKKKFGGEM